MSRESLAPEPRCSRREQSQLLSKLLLRPPFQSRFPAVGEARELLVAGGANNQPLVVARCGPGHPFLARPIKGVARRSILSTTVQISSISTVANSSVSATEARGGP